jgi:nicotinamidase-related amidase
MLHVLPKRIILFARTTDKIWRISVQALVVVDVQNEFSPRGRRAVHNHAEALDAIRRRVDEARREGRPIAWVRHHNRPHEWPGFEPGTWGAEFSLGCGPLPGRDEEAEFVKEVFGAFTGSNIGSWLEERGVDDVLIVGFYAHMCVSTTAREALMRGLRVAVDPEATGAAPIRHELLGEQTAAEVQRTALLQLSHLGVAIAPGNRGVPGGAE